VRTFLALAALTLTLAPTRPAPRDFSGVWNYATMTPLERSAAFGDRETLTPDEAAKYEQQTITRQENTNNTAGPDWWDPGTRHLVNRRTSLIVDPPNGRLPPLTPAAQAKAAERAQARRQRTLPDGPEDLGLNERCLAWAVAGPPMLPGVYNNNVEFVITKDEVVIHNEMIHEARIVPMDGRPHGTLRRWMGDSRGRWDADTLVIDTINFAPEVNVRGSDENLHLVERFTRTDANTIEYQITIDDSTVWTAAWTARFPMRRVNDRIYEYACHEGNFRSVEGILLGARAQERGTP
jgi:hypothetical protein